MAARRPAAVATRPRSEEEVMRERLFSARPIGRRRVRGGER
jgi:hypothetical protein